MGNKIEYITGDLLESDEIVIVQGCNAQGVQGSGIAGLIRKKWPVVFNQYREHYETHLGEDIMGEIVWVDVGTKLVANAITQRFYGGNKSVRYCSYDAIASAFEKLEAFAADSHVERIAMPLIGCGLANGRWSVVKAIIEASAFTYRPMVYLLDGKTPTS